MNISFQFATAYEYDGTFVENYSCGSCGKEEFINEPKIMYAYNPDGERLELRTFLFSEHLTLARDDKCFMMRLKGEEDD